MQESVEDSSMQSSSHERVVKISSDEVEEHLAFDIAETRAGLYEV